MIIPKAIHANRRNQLVQPNPYIIATQTPTPNKGIKGTNGVLNSRTILGSLTLSIMTEIQTNTKANKVPILVMSPTISPGINAANEPTMIKITMFAL